MKSEKIFTTVYYVALVLLCTASIHHAEKAGLHSAALWISGRYVVSIFAIASLKIKPEVFVINQKAMNRVLGCVFLINLAADNALIFPR
jgi:hypothetical protein